MGWREFVDDFNIDYKVASEDNIEIHCPMCGSSDRSKHLGLSITSSSYGCWRDESHRGVSPARIIKELLRCSWDRANELSKEYFNWRNTAAPKKSSELVPIKPPPEFFEFGLDADLENNFFSYLESRGYNRNIVSRFGLRYSLSGKFAHRIIIPVTYYKSWYTWVGRTISAAETLRYRAATTKDGVINTPTDFLFDFDNLLGGNKLLLVEGVFDAMRIQSAYIPGISATALFGQNISDRQIKCLNELKHKYKEIVVALDKDAYSHSLAIRQRLNWYFDKVSIICPSGKDWGEMSYSKIREELLAHAS